jgi:hypothetical protein
LIGKPEEKRQLTRPGHKWKDIIKMEFERLIWGMVN